jgi:hypothetical protein
MASELRSMLPPVLTSTRGRIARDVFLAAAVCIGALELFDLALAQWAALRIWDPWVIEYPVLGFIGPFGVIALACGVTGGLIVGALVRPNSLLVAAWAGALACVLSFGAALVVGGISFVVGNYAVIAALLLAVGLLAGALLGRHVRHA